MPFCAKSAFSTLGGCEGAPPIASPRRIMRRCDVAWTWITAIWGWVIINALREWCSAPPQLIDACACDPGAGRPSENIDWTRRSPSLRRNR